MEQVSHDKYLVQAEPTRNGVLESASKRVRMIFSVMASPNRIDILRILNSKGPLTYSELKSLAGFKSKKESGKFAYHLRKLLRQSLVALNKAERRYTITNLGKLVLSLARQIEERSIIESGKMYVRTTKPSIEEFNSNKIIHSLVREANMPLEQAHKITEEVENKIYKFQAVYLTSPLIRETVNSVLIEHGYEEYRNKLARLGLPSCDIVEKLASASSFRNGLDTIMSSASQSIFSEYLLTNVLPKDIADMHLAGELNISHSGTWGLVPDTIFLDVTDFANGSLDPRGKLLNVTRMHEIGKSGDFEIYLSLLISLLSKEASIEVVLEGIIPMILERTNSPDEISSRFAKALMLSSTAPSIHSELPVTTITIKANEIKADLVNALLVGYLQYVSSTPIPRIGISLIYGDSETQSSYLKYHIDNVVKVIRNGGMISLSHDDGLRANSGIRKSIGGSTSDAVVAYQSLSINLPRLAYQSNKDETYFRARLAMMIKPALAALEIRKNSVSELIEKGTLPVLINHSSFIQSGTTSIIVNLVGAKESVNDILEYHPKNDGNDILQKVLKTSVDVALDQKKYYGDSMIGVSMIADGSAHRFAALDSDKYGRAYLLSNQQPSEYSQGLFLSGEQLTQSSGNNSQSLIEECLLIEKILTGGLSVTLDVTQLDSERFKQALTLASSLPFLRPTVKHTICGSCGRRSGSGSLERCEYCKSPHLLATS
ncbi:anaerobic ribonucleoside-triphosphate reductase [Nitrososphaera sp. AFS]|jgi:ribonucleoside-triphosphate reductase|uniref:anaerobic ribonucleoside-triphosphate reductase n=1 Tax=Nitrososphaera sp. AFS TaxID=2301191 RepID=UPI0013922D62|nr:anaerobic ribonucleoside-triphosphate reductase [Nitrososphaera sp. AFS]NAL77556.1 ArsR family transcriptional regulator [Nitrososphaera sp. AFS]